MTKKYSRTLVTVALISLISLFGISLNVAPIQFQCCLYVLLIYLGSLDRLICEMSIT